MNVFEHKSEEVVISVENVSKCYRVYNKSSDRLKQSFAIQNKKYYKEFWSLENINFNLKRGETVGIIGGNGAGKSTLLQIIAGTLTPTSGTVKINGKVGALLELGSGFNPEFTGRENALLSGSIYGISEKEMLKRMSLIEEFADIGDFIDQPVKTYSSGMYSRLAFAVNMHVDAEILIVDEVLSVGDHFFQAKCMKAINQLSAKGCTILLVSHSQATIKALCNRAILLHEGKLEMDSSHCDEVIDRYFSLSLASTKEEIYSKVGLEEQDNTVMNLVDSKEEKYVSKFMPAFSKRISERFGNQKASFIEAIIMSNHKEVGYINTGETATIRVSLQYNEDIMEPGEVGIVVRTLEGVDLFAINTFFNNSSIPAKEKDSLITIDFTFPMRLGPGKYAVTLGYRAPIQGEYIDKVFNALIFEVINTTPRIIPLILDIEGSIQIHEGSE